MGSFLLLPLPKSAPPGGDRGSRHDDEGEAHDLGHLIHRERNRRTSRGWVDVLLQSDLVNNRL